MKAKKGFPSVCPICGEPGCNLYMPNAGWPQRTQAGEPMIDWRPYELRFLERSSEKQEGADAR